ncbi:contractile injection system protein, VgrG/Pvc8 family [Alteromonas sp. M12]|uniref:phage late control D family protein n=1 Tax=Alteromonas sp. M12 TaxID=3135644 RepID=UPI00319DE4E6
MTDSLFFNAKPAFNVDGEDINELIRDVVYMSVKEGLDGLKTLEARFTAIGPMAGQRAESLLYLDGRYLDFGKQVKVAIGAGSRQRLIFNGYISALEIHFEEGQEPEFSFCAEDRLMDLRMTRISKTYEEMSDQQIVEEIANQHGLQIEVDADGPTYNQIQQCNMSDLAFLRERARLLQAEVWVDAETLHFKTRDKRSGTSLTLIRGTDLMQVRVSADLAHQKTKVHVAGYDATQKQPIDEWVDEDAISSEIGAGRSGVSILKNAFGERISKRVMEVPLQAEEASVWAIAEMQRRARQFVTVNAISVGVADLVVGSSITLEQIGTPFSGDGYYVTKLEQLFTLAEGHQTHFEAQRAYIN